MSATQKKPVFYGWLLAGAAWLSTLTTTGMLGNTWSQFLKPVCEEFGMQRASFSMISLTASIIALLLYPIAGSVLNKHRSPWLIRGAVAVLLCGYVGYSFATTKAMLFISAVVYGLGGPFTNMLMVNIVLNNWFHAKKGFVMGFVSTGSGVGSAIFNPVASSLIANYGYRVAYRALGGFALLLLLPMLILYRFKPEDKGLLPYGIEPSTTNENDPADNSADASGAKAKPVTPVLSGMTRAEAVRTPKFYALVFICCAFSMGVVGVWNHISAYLTDIGYEPGTAAKLMSLVSITLACSKFFFGWLNDKIGTYKNFLLFTTLSVIGIFMVQQFNKPNLAILCAVLFGISYSETNIMTQLITVHVVGSAHFNDLYSIMSMASSFGAMAAGPFSGLVFDRTGSYTIAFTLYGFLYFAILVVGAIILRRGYDESHAQAA